MSNYNVIHLTKCCVAILRESTQSDNSMVGCGDYLFYGENTSKLLSKKSGEEISLSITQIFAGFCDLM